MNNNDILNAISNISPEFIDEAAFELHEAQSSDNPAADVRGMNRNRRRSIGKILYIAIPSAAAILLILSVALPAILRVGKSESASTADAPAATSEMPSESVAQTPSEEAADEAAAEEAYDAQDIAEAEPSYEAAAEAPSEPEPSAETSGAATKADSYKNDLTINDSDKTAEAEEAISSPAAVYDNGILTIETSELYHENFEGSAYKIFALGENADAEPAAEGNISDITDQTQITDEPLVLDLSSLKLEPGDYRIEMKTGTAEFTVPE